MFGSRVRFDHDTVGRIKFIEGLRTFMALVVIFHHVDLINPRINKVSNLIWTIDRSQSQPSNHQFHRVSDSDNIDDTIPNDRNLLSDKGAPKYGTLTTLGVIGSLFDITFFCLITGYVISLVAFRCFHHIYSLNHHPIHCTPNYPFWIYKFVRLMIRRSLKMLYSLFWVQCITFLLFHFECIELRTAEIWRANEYYYDDFWTLHCHFGAFFWSEINGALWVCDIFFWSTFAAFIVLSITINIHSINYRLSIYTLFCLWFHNGYYLPILMGIAAADIDHHQYYNVLFTSNRNIHQCLALSVLLLFVRIPIIGILPGHYLVFKSIGWFNLGLFCCQYPRCWITRLFAHHYLAFWGRYTFALYIWHIIVFRVIGTLINPIFIDVNDAEIDRLQWIDYVMVLFGAFVSIIFSIGFHHFVERPWNRRVVTPLLDQFRALQKLQAVESKMETLTFES